MHDGTRRDFRLFDVMLVFLWLNGYALEYEDKELINVILDLASGKITSEDLLTWILDHQN